MTAVVLDCSAALALVLPDERSDDIQDVVRVRDGARARLLVPSLWWYECTNVVLTAGRRGRIELSQAREALSLLSRLPDETIASDTLAGAVHLSHLGVEFALTAYDAAYLGVAESLGASLLTLDAPLSAAARSLGVPLALE